MLSRMNSKHGRCCWATLTNRDTVTPPGFSGSCFKHYPVVVWYNSHKTTVHLHMCVCECVYLVNEEKQRLSETTVFLCQVAIPPFLLFQDLPLALPQVQHILTVLLNTHTYTRTQRGAA